jgi:hypothetical protein
MHIMNAQWKKHELTTIFYLRQSWKDPRLASNAADRDMKYGPAIEDEIWLPDTFVPNSLQVDRFKDDGMVRLTPQGEVLWSTRMKMITPCPGRLSRLGEANPHRVNCSIELESYAHNNEELTFNWKSGSPLSVAPNADAVKRFRTERRTQSLSTGTYTRLISTLYVESQPLCQLEACVARCFAGGD